MNYPDCFCIFCLFVCFSPFAEVAQNKPPARKLSSEWLNSFILPLLPLLP